MYQIRKRAWHGQDIAIALMAAGLVAYPLFADAAPRSTATAVGGFASTAYAINDSGQVAGIAYTTDYTATYAFLSNNGSLSNLGTLGGTSSYAYGINNSGSVVGYANTAGGILHAFLYSSGTMTDLGVLGGTSSFAVGINASGQVAGYFINSAGALHAFLYENGTMTDLGAGYANGINSSGQMVGNSYSAGNGSLHAFSFSHGSMTDLGTLGGNYSLGRGINAGGQIVGYSSTANEAAQHAFLYSNGSMTDLGSLGGDSFANGINDSGQIVGSSYITANAPSHAFLYNNGTMYDLNNLAPTGETFYSAQGINRYAQIAVNSFNGGMVLTLHPDWQGGNGSWSDAAHWNFGGMGSFGITPGLPHDVVINPTGSANISGPLESTINSLAISGNGTNLVALNLANGSITALNGTTLGSNGTLAGSGRLTGDLAIQSGGRVFVGNYENQQLAGNVSVGNGGRIDVQAPLGQANLEVGGILRNDVGGRANLQNASVFAHGGTTNAGTISIAGDTTVSGAVDNLVGGQVNVSGVGSQAIFWDNFHNNGVVTVTNNATATFFGLVNGAGSFLGGGAKEFAGGYAPGNSPALTTISGPTAFSSGLVTMELGGTTPGTGHDKTIFNGPVTLGGAGLSVVYYNGWIAGAGQTYDLFDWNGGLTGTFASIALPTLANGLNWDTSQLYVTGDISVAAVPEPQNFAMLLAGLGLLGFVARRRAMR